MRREHRRRNHRRFVPFLAAGIVAATGAGLYLANPYRVTVQERATTETVHLAPKADVIGVAVCTSAADDGLCRSRFTGYAAAIADRNTAYVGEPVWLTLQTTRASMGSIPGGGITEAPGNPSPSVQIQPVSGVTMAPARPIIALGNGFAAGLAYINADYWTISPAGTTPRLAGLPAMVGDGVQANPGKETQTVWSLVFRHPGTYQVPVRFGGVVTRSIPIDVLPDPAGYRNVSYLAGTDDIPLRVTWISTDPAGYAGATGSATWTIDAQTTAGSIHQTGTITPGGSAGLHLPVTPQDRGTASVRFALAPGSTGYPVVYAAGIGVAQAPDLAHVQVQHTTTQARWLLSALWHRGAVIWPWGSRPRDWRWLVTGGALAAFTLALAPWRRRRGTAGNVQMETTEPEAEEAQAAAPGTPEQGPAGGDES